MRGRGWATLAVVVLGFLACGCGRAITAREARARLDPSRNLDVPPSRSGAAPSLVELAEEASHLSPPRRTIVEAALAHTGMPAGKLDCSSLVARVFAVGGIELPRTTREQLGAGVAVDSDALLPGDLVFFAFRHRPADHVGIFTGSGAFVHVSSSYACVRLESFSQGDFARAYVGARRLVP